MRRFRVVLLLFIFGSGCAPAPVWTDAGTLPPPSQSPSYVVPQYQNPLLVPAGDPEMVWNQVADVVDDYFRIEREEPVRLCSNVMTEGRLDTFPTIGSTLMEPWRHDSANSYERLESTLQSIRRWAVVRVLPGPEGYWIDVAVFKELEDVVPERATAGAATFRYDGGLTGVVNPIDDQPIEEGWIAMGRDAALEQRILGQIMDRFSTPQAPANVPYY